MPDLHRSRDRGGLRHAFGTARPAEAESDVSSLRTRLNFREKFVRRWHQAVGAELIDADELAELADYERSLLASIDADRHLRALSVNPLLCALLCALNRERRTHLLVDRMETYAAALDMLLDRRDRERGVTSGGVPLTRTDKILLLQDIAFWRRSARRPPSAARPPFRASRRSSLAPQTLGQ